MVLLNILRGCLAATLMAAATLAPAQYAESRIKAAFLYKFGGFIEWPAGSFPGPDASFVIGVLGDDAVAAELEELAAGRAMQERRLVVRRLREGEPLEGVQMLFVGDAQNARLAGIAVANEGRPVLIVSESESATTRGSMINFVREEDKIRFDIAPDAAERRHIRISARLLTVARRVVRS